jgi:heparan-alpha-glucosaminide N-acetyltransferase
MISRIELSAAGENVIKRAPRVGSIDVFRGLTMTLMIFVNELAGIKSLPWWNYHAPAKLDAMTYVDMVFPAFLFILGMTIPIALERRLQKNGSLVFLLGHILVRTIALLTLGLILANAEQGDSARMGIGTNLWTILALIGAVVFWNVYGRSERHRILFRVLRFSGLALMLTMLLIFRRIMPNGEIAWLNFSYPEILGLLGFSYFSVSILYLATRRFCWAPLAWLIALLLFCAASTAKWLVFLPALSLFVWPVGNGAMCLIAMAGVVVSTIFLGGDGPNESRFLRKALRAVSFGVLSLLCGWLLTPLGISKIRATPTWCLYCVGANTLLFTLLYWICDVRGWKRWARFARPAGENTLLTYLLPDFYYFIVTAMGITYFSTHANSGLAGVFRSIAFTAIILMLSGVLTRWKIRLQL